MANVEVFDLFPTPVRRIPQLIAPTLVEQLTKQFSSRAQQRNAQSGQLNHTQLVDPQGHETLREVCNLAAPHVAEFGTLLFGELLAWSLKEMWINVLERGGRQALHNHANSFVSGVVYLTASHASANTVFAKGVGGSEFVFNNTNARAQLGPYNAGKWISPDPTPGDLLLFPSYLLHEVPTNQGGRRITLAFNAIPTRLDSWGYTLSLSR